MYQTKQHVPDYTAYTRLNSMYQTTQHKVQLNSNLNHSYYWKRANHSFKRQKGSTDFLTFLLFVQRQRLVYQGLHIFEALRSHSTQHPGRNPLDDWSAYRTCNTQNREIFMTPARFEPEIPGSERLRTHALNRRATRIESTVLCNKEFSSTKKKCISGDTTLQ
jgi:hypothetical protein